MSKSSSKRKKKQKAKIKKANPEFTIPVSSLTGLLRRIWDWFRKPLNLILAFVAFLAATGFPIYHEIKNFLTTDKEEYDDNYIIKDSLKAPKISSDDSTLRNADFTTSETPPDFNIKVPQPSYPRLEGIQVKDLRKKAQLMFQVGNSLLSVPILALDQGFRLELPGYKDCINESLQVAAKDDRLYVSTKIKDFKTGELIGDMTYNHWQLYKGSFKNYRADNSFFEVLDKYGNIAFSMSTDQLATFDLVRISGYFVNPKSVLIITNAGIVSGDNSAPVGTLFNHGVDGVNRDVNALKCVRKDITDWIQQTEIAVSRIISTDSIRQAFKK